MVQSQFLFSNSDELISDDLVRWVEGPLSAIPAIENRDATGFQRELADLSAGPRTRAGEAYRIGLLTGRLVRPQGGGAAIPFGWTAVIEGRLPLTRLGIYAYLIGKPLSSDPNTPNLNEALDLLACAEILHIAIKIEGRWYCTALIAQFARDQLEGQLGRELDATEVRYLSGGVINTLDGNARELLLKPYVTGGPIVEIVFNLPGNGLVRHNFSDLPTIAADKPFGINDFVKPKAALFWAQPERGIYSRAYRSSGFPMIRALLGVDMELAAQGQPNPLSEMLEALDRSDENPGLFTTAEAAFSDHTILFQEWQRFEQQLFEHVNAAVDIADVKAMPSVWREVQKSLRASTPSEIEGRTPPDEGIGAFKPAAENPGSSFEAEQPPPDLAAYVDAGFGNILVAHPPPSTGAVGGATGSATSVDIAKKDAANRELGCNGELFVVEYERAKLRRAGRDDLAAKVAWVSQEVGDGLGYDVSSFREDGVQLRIEVKTTKAGKATPFYISANELNVWRSDLEAYRLYRVFAFGKGPKLFILEGDPDQLLKLEPLSYRARL